jgi:hypothetical protein
MPKMRRENTESRPVHQLALLRACLACGGDERELARKLSAPLGKVVEWLLGMRDVPPTVFLRAVDIVVGAQKQHVEDTRALLRRIRARHAK